MTKVIHQTTAGRLWINNQEFSIEDLVMEYTTSLQSGDLISIHSKTHSTGVSDTPLTEIEDDNGDGYANITAWVNWWKALDVGADTAPSGVATEENQDTLLGKQFPNVGIHVLEGTGAATSGTYTGFLVLEEATVSAITLTDSSKVTGDSDFSEVTLPAGIFIEIPGGFSTITLSAGSMILIKG
jgi:hypothetical protein